MAENSGSETTDSSANQPRSITAYYPKGKFKYKYRQKNIEFLVDPSFEEQLKEKYDKTFFKADTIGLSYQSDQMSTYFTPKKEVGDRDKNHDKYIEEMSVWRSSKIYIKPKKLDGVDDSVIAGVFAYTNIPPNTFISRMGGHVARHKLKNIVEIAASKRNDLLVIPIPYEDFKKYYTKRSCKEIDVETEKQNKLRYTFVTYWEEDGVIKDIYPTSFIKIAKPSEEANAKLSFVREKIKRLGRYPPAEMCVISIKEIKKDQEILLEPPWDWNKYEDKIKIWREKEEKTGKASQLIRLRKPRKKGTKAKTSTHPSSKRRNPPRSRTVAALSNILVDTTENEKANQDLPRTVNDSLRGLKRRMSMIDVPDSAKTDLINASNTDDNQTQTDPTPMSRDDIPNDPDFQEKTPCLILVQIPPDTEQEGAPQIPSTEIEENRTVEITEDNTAMSTTSRSPSKERSSRETGSDSSLPLAIQGENQTPSQPKPRESLVALYFRKRFKKSS